MSDDDRSWRAVAGPSRAGVGLLLRESTEGLVVQDIVRGGPADLLGRIDIGDILVRCLSPRPMRPRTHSYNPSRANCRWLSMASLRATKYLLHQS